MAYSAFADKDQEPRKAELQETLGRSGARWNELIAFIEKDYGPLTIDWNFGGAKWGWILRLRQKKRVVLYMTPRDRHFIAGLVLGEKAVALAQARPLDPAILTLVDEAPRYGEGRGIRVEVRTKRDVESVRQLAAAKMTT